MLLYPSNNTVDSQQVFGLCFCWKGQVYVLYRKSWRNCRAVVTGAVGRAWWSRLQVFCELLSGVSNKILTRLLGAALKAYSRLDDAEHSGHAGETNDAMIRSNTLFCEVGGRYKNILRRDKFNHFLTL